MYCVSKLDAVNGQRFAKTLGQMQRDMDKIAAGQLPRHFMVTPVRAPKPNTGDPVRAAA